MECKHCGAPLEDGQELCPACGLRQDAAEPAAEAPETTEEAAVETPGNIEEAAEAPEAPASKTPGRKNQRGAIGLLLALVAVAAAAVVILVLSLSRRSEPAPETPETAQGDLVITDAASGSEVPGTPDDPAGAAEDPTLIEHVDENGQFIPHSYTKSSAEVTEEDVSRVVAACGEWELTNGQLSFYYWQQFYRFMSTYGSYIAMLGLDLSQPMSEQMYDETHTWEDMFLRMAVTAFWQDSAVRDAAARDGFAAGESVQQYVDAMLQSLEDTAEVAGYENGDAYIQSMYGPHITAQDYADYARVSLANDDYLGSVFGAIACGEAEVNAYFDEHADEFAAQGLSKDDPNMVNVRHVLITPKAAEDAETDENGQPVLTDADWAAAEARAQEILTEWTDGAATEESFATLAAENTEDPGSQSTGGLYENVYPGQMVETFNDWCFDPARQPGDTGIVRTDYGFHVMYFSSTCDRAYWYDAAEQQYLSTKQQEIVQEMLDAMPITVDYEKVVLMENEALTAAE